MSYDITLMINTGFEDREVLEIGNMTYNVAPMYMLAMGKSLCDFNGKQCKDIIPILRCGWLHMETKPEKYKALNPPNGWGDYKTALDYLEKILDGCEYNPKCKIIVT